MGIEDDAPGLTVPHIAQDADTLSAALAYAKAGWYVLPAERGTKKPGSVVGDGWQHKSSRNPKQIAAWFAGTDHDIALHCGRSGAIAFDVDKPAKLPEVLRDLYSPYQSSRPEQPGRGHYVFAMPVGRTIGNGTGKLGNGWGEVRGLNGVIVAEPSYHKDGGEYRWQRIGPVPVLPDEIADLLNDTTPGEDAATDKEVVAFLETHCGGDRPKLLLGPVRKLEKQIDDGESRHDAATSVAVWAMDEAAAGLYSADDAQAALREVFTNSVTCRRKPDDRVLDADEAKDEFDGILAWAVGQAKGKTAEQLDAIRSKANRKGNDVSMLRESGDDAGKNSNAETNGETTDLTDQFVVTLTPASEIVSDIPDWVWEHEGLGRIQRGVLTLFAGRPGAGKSTGARWFASRFSRGDLDGCWKGKPQKVAYIASEEGQEHVVKPGLQVAGADMDNITFPTVTFNGEAVALMSDRDEARLTKELKAQGVSVIFVDPVMATIRRKVDIYRNNELRDALAPWVRIAQRINGIVVGVVHLTKGTNGDVVASINGSSGFGEVARCVFGFVKDPQNEGERVMSQDKNACGVEDLSLTYEIAVQEFTADTGRKGPMPLFSITGESDTSVREILASAGSTKLRTKMQQVCDLVNGRDETDAQAVVDSGLSKSRNAATKTLERLYKRGHIDRPTWGSYCPKVTT